MITVLNHPLVENDLAILRSKSSGTEDFRNASFRIGLHLAIESMKDMETEECEISTPMENTAAKRISGRVILMPILRAGLGLVNSFQTVFPASVFGYIGLRRNEETFIAEEYYFSMPEIKPHDKIIILEIMLATGGSTAAALSKLQLDGAENITVVSVISVPEGIERIRTEFPKARIITAAMDRELNRNKYILPGLGDAGDRFSGH